MTTNTDTNPSNAIDTEMTSEHYKKLIYKYIIVGDSGVGKTCLLLRMTTKRYEPTYDMTIGVDFGQYEYDYGDKLIKLQIWDTAGQESFRSITRAYYRGAVCAILVYDVTSRHSFESIRGWLSDIYLYSNYDNHITIVLVANKIDATQRRVVSTEEGKNLAMEYKIIYYETSAKTGDNVSNIFLTPVPIITDKVLTGDIELSAVSPSYKSHRRTIEMHNQDKNTIPAYCYC